MVIWAADQQHHYKAIYIYVGNSNDADTDRPLGEAFIIETAAPNLSALPTELKVRR